MHQFIESGNPFLTTVYHFSVNDSVKNISALSINRTLIDEIFYSEELRNLNSFLFKRRDIFLKLDQTTWIFRSVGSINLSHNVYKFF